MTTSSGSRPGPRRLDGLPVGPDEVRLAVLDAAARLFAVRGVDGVSLRDVAAEAEVNVALIQRYVGTREELLVEVFNHVSAKLTASIEAHPLEGQGFTPDTAMGAWVRIAASLAISGRRLEPPPDDNNPVLAMAETLRAGYGLSDEAARVRAAQIVAAALGWRIFETYLVDAGGLGEIPVTELREDLVHSARRLGATGWPSPPDPVTRESRPRRG